MIRATDTLPGVVLATIDGYLATAPVPTGSRECVESTCASTLRTGIAYRLYVGDAGQGKDIGIERVVHVGERFHLVLGDFVSLLHLFDGKKWGLARNHHRGRGLTYPEVHVFHNRLADRQNDIARDSPAETCRRDLHLIRANRQQRKVIGTVRARLLALGEPRGSIADRHPGPRNGATERIKHTALESSCVVTDLPNAGQSREQQNQRRNQHFQRAPNSHDPLHSLRSSLFRPAQLRTIVHLFALEVLATHGCRGTVAFSSGLPAPHFPQSG